MTKRNTQQRRHTIVTKVNTESEVSVEQLAALFETSEVTIRKDLSALEKSGLLLRRYGGAISLPKEITDTNDRKVSIRKKKLGELASSLIKDHHRIIIDSGRTTSTIVDHLSDKKGLVVMTNALSVANRLNELESEPTILMTGGTWDPVSESFQGQVAEQVIKSYDFDQLYIGADGLDLDRGTTTFNELIGLSQVMADCAREVIVLLESDKIARKIPNLELSWEKIDTLITDQGIGEQIKQQILALGVNVLCISE